MFSKLNEKAKAALFFAVGMGCFLVAGSLVYFFPKSQLIDQGVINRTNDSSIQELYRDLTETGPNDQVSMVTEIEQYAPAQRVRAEADNRWVLYVTGSVRSPGVYRLPERARVYQLVEAAGGLTMVADAVAINMAAQLQDGDHLHVPQRGDDDSVRNRNRSSERSYGTVIVTNAQSGQTMDGAAVRNQRGNNNARIDINTASAAELQMLPGIGPAMAARIIQYRNQNGRFKQVSDLINVPGIGGKRLESIEPLVFVR